MFVFDSEIVKRLHFNNLKKFRSRLRKQKKSNQIKSNKTLREEREKSTNINFMKFSIRRRFYFENNLKFTLELSAFKCYELENFEDIASYLFIFFIRYFKSILDIKQSLYFFLFNNASSIIKIFVIRNNTKYIK